MAEQRAAEAGRVLRFGCAIRTVADWRANLVEICAKHEPTRVVEFTVDAADATKQGALS